MRPDEHAQYEQWAGSTCFGIWEPAKVGMEFVAQTGGADRGPGDAWNSSAAGVMLAGWLAFRFPA